MEPIALRDIRKQVETLGWAERVFDAAVLFALFEVGAFRALAEGPRTFGELEAAVGGDAETLRAVCDAAVALGVLRREDGRYAAPEALLDSLGRPEAPAYLGEWVAFLHALAPALLRLGERVRTGRPPASLLGQEGGGDGTVDPLPAQRMTAAMDAYARSRGVELAERIALDGARTLLDVGCGPGTYGLALAARHPGLRVTLLDLPGPLAEARRRVEASGLAGRVALVAADARTWSAPEPFDVVLVSNTLHMLGPDDARALLRRCLALVTPGGRIVVHAQYLYDDRTSPRWATLLSLVQRVATPHGRNHALGETADWLREAGFRDVEHVRFSAWNVCSALVARRAR